MCMYRCPKCHKELNRIANSYICDNHHCYDIAKSGYVNLCLHQRKAQGDNKEMVQARSEFLQQAYYEPLRQRLIALMKQYPSYCIIDAGCGQGYYTNEIAKAMPSSEVYGFDLSKFALKKAAGKVENTHYALASIADLPLCDHCADIIISVFAPIYEKEFDRLLKTNGCFIKVGPGPKHLWELKQLLYETVYENEAPKPMDCLKLIHSEALRYETDFADSQHIQALLMMTPYAYRTPKSAIQRLETIENLHTTLDFYIQVWQKQ